MSDLTERALAIIGADALCALERAGLTVIDGAELDRYQTEQAESVERARRIARAALEAAETRGLLVDILLREDGSLRVVVCDPSGNEDAMAARVVAAMGVAHGPLTHTGTPPERAGRAGADSPRRHDEPRVGMTFEEVANLDLGTCGGTADCECRACQITESFTCACGVKFVDHGDGDCPMGTRRFSLTSWLKAPAKSDRKGQRRARRKPEAP